MRISALPDDPGYRLYRRLPRRVQPVISVNGQDVKHACTADTKRGLVLAVKTDAKGNIEVNARRNAFAMQQLRGKVAVRFVRT